MIGLNLRYFVYHIESFDGLSVHGILAVKLSAGPFVLDEVEL